MKKTYEAPELELIETDDKDIITSSPGNDLGNNGDIPMPSVPF